MASRPSPSSPPPRRRRSASDFAVAFALAAVVAAALVATSPRVGHPRDEGFYYRFSIGYAGWIARSARALAGAAGGDRLAPLRRAEVERTWKANAEHPPLAKVLFGLSWRLFGRKLRPIVGVRGPGAGRGETIVSVSPVEDADGFEPGARLLLLRAVPAGAPQTVAQRVVGRAVVVERRGHRVRARVVAGTLSAKTRKRLCEPPEGLLPWRTCEAMVEGSGPLSESLALRLPAIVLFALLVASVYLFGAVAIGRTGALFAAVALAANPRVFFHAHLAAFDVPVTAFVFWTVWAWWASLRTRRAGPLAGVVWGLALLTKHNAFFVPVGLAFQWVVDRLGSRDTGGPSWLRARLPVVAAGALAAGLAVFFIAGTHRAGLALAGVLITAGIVLRPRASVAPRLPRATWWMAVLGPALFVGLWPRLWYDTWAHLRWYFAFHLHHVHYTQVYFGRVLGYPPFPTWLPFALAGLTQPLPVVAAVAAGVALLAARFVGLSPRPSLGLAPARRGWDLGTLLLVHALYPIAVIALPNTPIFGGTKHWLHGWPFALLAGGVAVQWAADALASAFRRAAPRRAALAALLAALLVPGVVATAHCPADGTAWYNALAGGPPGAAAMDMQRQFWGASTLHALPVLDERVPRGATVYFHKCVRDAWSLYRRDGALRQDIRYDGDIFDFGAIEARIRRTPYAVFHHQQDHSMYELAIWRAYGVHTPVWQFSLDGVPIVSVYRNPRWHGR